MTDRNDAQDAGLLPCPFCGGTPNIRYVEVEADWYVECQSCGVWQPMMGRIMHTKEQAIAEWNRRAPQPVSAELDADTLATIRAAVAEYEYARRAFFDGHPAAIADADAAAKAKAALAQLEAATPQPDWSYSGGATVQTSGGGLLHMRLDGAFPQLRPQDGKHEATVTITFAYSPQPDAEEE